MSKSSSAPSGGFRIKSSNKLLENPNRQSVDSDSKSMSIFDSTDTDSLDLLSTIESMKNSKSEPAPTVFDKGSSFGLVIRSNKKSSHVDVM
jgi:hypothetical protein